MAIKEAARGGLLGVLILVLAAPPGALAQMAPPYPPPPPGAPAAPTFRQEELDQLLAPVALYPDALLAQILMAATYPLEVVQADRWVKAYPNVKGPQLEAAMQQQPWDPSVKSLTAFPQVLAMMDGHLEWTQRLGDAFLAQEQDVMATVQSLRAKAYAAGYLQNTPQQTVTVQPQLIMIEPAAPQVVYVPIYDPTVVYGPWWYPAYTPFYWYPPGYAVGTSVFAFGLGLAVGAVLWGGFDWHHHNVTVVNVHNYNTFNRTTITTPTWHHDPAHRWGVPYHDPGLRQRFGQGAPSGVAAREAYRGRTQGVPPQTRQGSFDRRQGGGSSAPSVGALQGSSGTRRPVEARRPLEQPQLRSQSPGGGASPAIGGTPQGGSGPPKALEGRRRAELEQLQRQGAGPGAPVGGGPQASPPVVKAPVAPHPAPGALEGLGRGGEARSFSDRGRMSRGGTGTATLPTSVPPTIRGGTGAATKAAPSAPQATGKAPGGGGGPAHRGDRERVK